MLHDHAASQGYAYFPQRFTNSYFMLLHTENNLKQNVTFDCRLMKSQDVSGASALNSIFVFSKFYLFRNILKTHSHFCEFLFNFLCVLYFDPP